MTAHQQRELDRANDREKYASWRQCYNADVQRGGGTPVKHSTPVPGAMPRGVTRQGT